jgi:mannose-6-phosphate isomerase-like protein (cupin superfamily)
MSVFAPEGSVTEQIADMGNTSFSTKAVYGNESSLMIATRPAGYHSRPHTHDCEQLNWLQSGELWIFIEDRAYKLESGDFLRVPRGARHWSWNRADTQCVLVEVHAPGLHADPLISEHAVGLFDEGEGRAFTGAPYNTFLVEGSFDTSVAESHVK